MTFLFCPDPRIFFHFNEIVICKLYHELQRGKTRKKSFQIILRPDVIIALFLFPRGATKCSSRAMWSPEAGDGEETVVSC